MGKLNKEIWVPLFIRLGLAGVFFLFGYHKLSVPSQATAEIELLLSIGISPASVINFYLGLIEIIIAVFLLLGIYVKETAFIAGTLVVIFFSSIIFKYGLTQNPTLNRDLGLIGAAFSLWLIGPGPLSVDVWMKKRKEQKGKDRIG